ncbi:MAG: hypothetical protein CMJ23_14225 [Phycisphaerae bacterium]|nr:hypothetical protein [Phycisphaerae bacterium]
MLRLQPDSDDACTKFQAGEIKAGADAGAPNQTKIGPVNHQPRWIHRRSRPFPADDRQATMDGEFKCV